jgi:predicted nucleotidyltransferase
MIKSTKLPDNIEHLLEKAEAYLQARPDVAFGYLFGSFATGRTGPLSDIDIALYLAEAQQASESKMEILGDLIDLLQTDEVDLVIMNAAPLPLRMKIIANRKVIVDNTPFQRHRYESLTMREYFDFAVREMDILERRFRLG